MTLSAGGVTKPVGEVACPTASSYQHQASWHTVPRETPAT